MRFWQGCHRNDAVLFFLHPHHIAHVSLSQNNCNHVWWQNYFFPPIKLITVLWEETLRLCKYPVLIQLSPSGFSINRCSLPELIVTIMIDKWQFSNSITPFKLNRWPSTPRKNFVFSPCVYSFVHFHQCKLIDSYST